MATLSSDDWKAAESKALQTQETRFATLRAQLSQKHLTIVVFGASGHLAKTKTYPALYDLFVEGILPKEVAIVGFARSKSTNEQFREKIESHLKGDKVAEFVKYLTYYSAKGYDDDKSYEEFGKFLSTKIECIKDHGDKTNRLCYMALPPSVFGDVLPRVRQFVQTTKEQGWTRVIVEKPFGKDSKSSADLGLIMSQNFTEDQVYRIDHYLAKEMVQNIFVFRFANTIWSSLWDRRSIRCVKISMKETAGVEGRGGYYDEFGVLRDIFQNHLMQVLTLIAMEQPVTMDANDVRDEKVKVLKAIEPIDMRRSVIGQYGKSADGAQPGYLDDESVKKVNPNSTQITFAQTVVFIKNGRWSGVPFICKCGKALDARNTEVRIQFKNDGLTLFGESAFNELVIRLQPNEALWLKVNTKTPGFAGMDSSQAYELDLTYKNRFGDIKLPEAYTRLILDCLEGQQSLFVREDELRESWRICTPFLHFLEGGKGPKPQIYARGGRGPAEADEMAEKYGFLRNDQYAWHGNTPEPKKTKL